MKLRSRLCNFNRGLLGKPTILWTLPLWPPILDIIPISSRQSFQYDQIGPLKIDPILQLKSTREVELPVDLGKMDLRLGWSRQRRGSLKPFFSTGLTCEIRE